MCCLSLPSWHSGGDGASHALGAGRDAVVDKVAKRVLEGMGLIVLHSGHVSKPFRKLMGTSGSLKWRECQQLPAFYVAKERPLIKMGPSLGNALLASYFGE